MSGDENDRGGRADIPSQGLTENLREAHDAEPAVAQRAKARLYAYLDEQFKSYVEAQANRAWDNGLRPSDLFQSVFARMLKADLPYEDTQEFRAAFCRMISNRAIDYLRRRDRQMATLPEGDTLADSMNREGAYTDVEWLYEAMNALQEADPDLATVLRIRFLSDFRIRFPNGAVLFGSADASGDEGRTFREMAEFLGISTTAVYKKYQQAIQWLRDRYPGHVSESGDFSI
jgi:RNA polymerase sigma factor (sigma-70 family)